MIISDEFIEKIFKTIIASIFTLVLNAQIPQFITELSTSSNFSVTSVFIYQGIGYLLIPTYIFLLVKIWFEKDFAKKYNLNVYYIIYVFTISSFVFAYMILELGKRLSDIPTVKIGSADGWLAFIGSIIGGVITMLAVVFTINNERDIREKDLLRSQEVLAIQSIPLINITIPDELRGQERKTTVLPYNNGELKPEIKEDLTFPLKIFLINNSNYHARDLKFTEFNMYTFTNLYNENLGDDKDKYISKSRHLYNFTEYANEKLNRVKLLPGNFNEKIIIYIPYDYLDLENLRIVINLKYKDYLELLEHEVSTEIILDFENKKDVFYDGNACTFTFKLLDFQIDSKFNH